MKLSLKLNIDIRFKGKTFKKGSVIELQADSLGNPKDMFWRSILKTSHVDKSVEVLAKEKSKKVKK
jgi:hypothetical protein